MEAHGILKSCSGTAGVQCVECEDPWLLLRGLGGLGSANSWQLSRVVGELVAFHTRSLLQICI